MRVTIGERLGIPRTKQMPVPVRHIPDEAAPTWIEPETAGPITSFYGAPSSTMAMGHPIKRELEEGEPERIRGEMVWLNKTAPILVIQGRPDLSAEDHAAGRRR